MPIIELSDHVGYIPGAVNIGVIRIDDSSCAMVDTGLNDTTARKALKTINEEWGVSVTHVLTTHAHADHFGGNATVVRRTGAQVWAPVLDEAIIRYPLLQPSLLFAGADPPPSLRGRFLLADPSPVDLVYAPGEIELGERHIDVIDLSGHSPGQLGLVIQDVFFCADVVLPASVLEKYRIPYLYSVIKHRAALARAGSVGCSVVVPGHGESVESLRPLIDLNLGLLDQVEEAITALIMESAMTVDEIYQRLAARFDAPIADQVSYFLLQPTVYAFLSALETSGRARSDVIAHQLRWTAISP